MSVSQHQMGDKDKNNNISTFAKEFAKYSTSAERSNDLISDIEKILNRNLSQEEKFKLRLNIETFISLGVIYSISSWSTSKVDQNKKDEFLSQYGEYTKEIFQVFGYWSPRQLENYANSKSVAAKLYHQSLKGKTTPDQKDLDRLWDNFAHSVVMGLNFGPQINAENEPQYYLLLKVIKLKIASLHFEVMKKLDENKELFL